MNKYQKLAVLSMAIAVLPIYGAFTLTVVWSWFVSETFGIIEITKLQAYGLMLVSTTVRPSFPDTEKDEWYAAAVRGLGLYSLVLIIASVVKWLMP